MGARSRFARLLYSPIVAQSRSVCGAGPAGGASRCGAVGVLLGGAPRAGPGLRSYAHRLGNPWGGAARALHAPPGGKQIQGTQDLLDSIQAAKLCDELASLADERPAISYKELLAFIKLHNGADSDTEAEERANALTRAGVVLRLGAVVYLRPAEIAELVYRAVPTDPAEAQRRLEEVEGELVALEAQHMAIKRAASRWPRFWLQVGCIGVFAQLVGFAYLTWWELSWDVMEPIAYMLSVTYTFLAYIYFLSRGTELDYGPFMQYWTNQQLRKKAAEKGFDVDRYNSLLRQSERYRKYLAAQAAAARGGQAM